jgi:CRISPR-associated protein Cas2
VTRHVLVCYDICEPSRLRRVHRVVRDFGRPLQYSVFACRLSAVQQADLEARLLEEIDQTVDQVMLVDLGPVDRSDLTVPGTRVLGQPRRPEIVGTVVL